ncbi:sulfatase-like hydrolase/transferase [Myxococcota bacterium]|nr:sulfatase-like hydrolase/transferase [Myxococcota bacterium]
MLQRTFHIAALAAFAFAQPVFEVLRLHPTFLVAHDADFLDGLALACALGLALPLMVGLGVASLARVSGRFGNRVQQTFVMLLVALVVLPALQGPQVETGLSLLLAGLTGALTASAYRRFPAVQRVFSFLALAVLVFPLRFVASDALRDATGSSYVPGRFELRVEQPVPVVLVVFDALALHALVGPGERVDARRHPNFAALAEDSLWFVDATTVAEKTRAALPALLTGNYPVKDRTPTASEYPANLFTLLEGDYAIHALEPLTRLCPTSSCGTVVPRTDRLANLVSDVSYIAGHVLVPPPWKRALPDVSRTWRDFGWDGPVETTREQTTADSEWLLERFLKDLQPGPQPGLYFVHFPVPHWPYRYLPSGLRYGGFGRHTTPQYEGPRRFGDRDFEEAVALQPYLIQVAYVDRLLGRVVEGLRAAGLYDSALLIVTSDHGVSFNPGWHARLYSKLGGPDIAPIPLFVKLPNRRAVGVLERRAELVDVLPTVLDVVDATPLPVMDGRSLLAPEEPGRAPKQLIAHRLDGTERFEVSSPLPERTRTARLAARNFALSLGAQGLFGLGPLRGQLGRPVSTLPMADVPGFEVTLDHAFAYLDVDPASGFVPAFVAGRLEFPWQVERPSELLVAVDGVVSGMTRSFDPSGRSARFEALVSDRAFAPGRNEIEVLALIESDGVGEFLRAGTRRAGAWRSFHDDVGRPLVLRSPDDRWFPVVPGAVEGEVERVRFDFRGRTRGTEVLMWAEGRVLSHRRAETGSDPFEFEFAAPDRRTEGDSSGHVRFLAIGDNRASAIGPAAGDEWPRIHAPLLLLEDEQSSALILSPNNTRVLDGEVELQSLERLPQADERLQLTGRVATHATPGFVMLFSRGRLVAQAPLSAGGGFRLTLPSAVAEPPLAWLVASRSGQILLGRVSDARPGG